jgi:nucleotidyltransferase substrate binding protein (TIGR01987 family)
LLHLSEINNCDTEETPIIIKEGFIQRFEYTFELAWKTLYDYLTWQGLLIDPTPKEIIKNAFDVKTIDDEQMFLAMIDAKNLTRKEYNDKIYNIVFEDTKHKFYPALYNLRVYLEKEVEELSVNTNAFERDSAS